MPHYNLTRKLHSFSFYSLSEVGGAYGHPLFLRDRSDLAAQISRAPNASKSRRSRSKASQQDSSACSDHDSRDTMNKGMTLKLESLDHPTTDRMTLTANSISVILAELERNDVLDPTRGTVTQQEHPVHTLPKCTINDNTKLMPLSNATCGMESLFMPSWRQIEDELDQIEVDRDDIRTEIIKTFLW